MNQLFESINSEQLKLSPPWYTIYRDIKSTVGADSFVHVQDLKEENESSYLLHIFVDYPEKAQALATVLLDQYKCGNITITIRIMDIEGNIYYPQEITGDDKKDQLREIVDKAFASNDLYYGVEDGATMLTTWVVIIAKTVIQYYNDNLVDFYANNNEVASEIFKRILRMNYGENLKICITTDIDRNVNPLDEEEKKDLKEIVSLSPPWIITYYLIKAFLGVDESLIIRQMYEGSPNTYYIDVHTMNGVKARCLAKIMKTYYDYGNIQLYVRFFDLSQISLASPIEIRGKNVYKVLTRVIKKAYDGNSLFKNVINLQGLVPEEIEQFVGNIVLVISKEVIQIYASDIQDFWGNKNYVAAEALKEIMNLEYLIKNTAEEEVNIRVNTTTEYDRDVLD